MKQILILRQTWMLRTSSPRWRGWGDADIPYPAKQ